MAVSAHQASCLILMKQEVNFINPNGGNMKKYMFVVALEQKLTTKGGKCNILVPTWTSLSSAVPAQRQGERIWRRRGMGGRNRERR